MPIMMRGYGGGSSGGYKYQLGNVKDLKYTYTRTQLSITWSDPDNVLLNGNILSEWFGTVVVCKKGSKPISIEDGEVIYISREKNKHKTNPLVITTGGEGYYYGVFPYTKDYVVNVLDGNILLWQFPTLNDMSWTEIANAVESGEYKNYWKVGDKKSVTLSGEVNGIFEVQIADFDFYDKTDGSGKAGIVFTFTKNVIENAGMYCGLRYNKEKETTSLNNIDMLGDEISKIRNSLPSDLRSRIKKVNAPCCYANSSQYAGSGPRYGPKGPMTVSLMKNEDVDIFPPSFAEVMNNKGFSRRYLDNSGYTYYDETVKEGEPLELFKYTTDDNLKGGPLDKGGETFTRTVYSYYNSSLPGNVRAVAYDIDSDGKLVTPSIIYLKYNFGQGSDPNGSGSSFVYESTGNGKVAGLCPLFCI